MLVVYIRGVSEDATHNALAAPSRRRLLDALRAAAAPVDVPTLAAATGLHPNTVRFHLEVLMEAGFVYERSDRRGTRGRPRTVYATTTPDRPGVGYQVLAQALVTHLDEAGDESAGEGAGEAWARRLWPGPPARPADIDTVARTVTALFTELGFDPMTESDTGRRRIMLRACPFWALAERHPGVVCAVHFGLLRGLVAQAGLTGVKAGLSPFVEPRLCRADLVAPGPERAP
jgi:predicted ArsR family transcriptional regulator